MHQHKNFRLIQKWRHFSFSRQVFRVDWIPTSFSLASTAVQAERMALYIRRCFSFCLDYMHVPYNKYEDKLTTLYLQAS